MPLHVLTGASGAGKSSVIDALARGGFQTQPEIGRILIREQKLAKSDALPWADRKGFRDLLFARSVAAFDEISDRAGPPIFFDRSFIDALAYSTVIDCEPSSKQRQEAAARPFDDPVFVFPPWEDIYRTDTERKHGFNEAVQDYEANVAAYSSLGYRLLEVPKAPVSERVRFVLENMDRDD